LLGNFEDEDEKESKVMRLCPATKAFPFFMQRSPSRLRVKAASRCALEPGGETPPQLAGGDACATSFLETR